MHRSQGGIFFVLFGVKDVTITAFRLLVFGRSPMFINKALRRLSRDFVADQYPY